MIIFFKNILRLSVVARLIGTITIILKKTIFAFLGIYSQLMDLNFKGYMKLFSVHWKSAKKNINKITSNKSNKDIFFQFLFQMICFALVSNVYVSDDGFCFDHDLLIHLKPNQII